MTPTLNESEVSVLNEIAAGLGLSLTQAARRIPSNRGGRPVHTSCLLRWVRSGIRLTDGRTIRLEAARLAGRWLTTESAIARFLAAQTPHFETAPAFTLRTPTQRRRASERAARELSKIGI